jgi:hypothetical protein
LQRTAVGPSNGLLPLLPRSDQLAALQRDHGGAQ